MDRKELLDLFEIAKPGLDAAGLVPAFEAYCFTGDHLYTYKDSIGIKIPCECPESFGVHGVTITGLLKNTRVNNIEFKIERDTLVCKAGKSKIKLPYVHPDDFLLEEPEFGDDGVVFELDEALMEGLQLCKLTASTDTSAPALMGVAVQSGDCNSFYSCDGDSLSHYVIDTNDQDYEGTYMLSNDFCDALLRMQKGGVTMEGVLTVNDEWAEVVLHGGIKLIGRVIEVPDRLDYADIMSRTMKTEPAFVAPPKGLYEALSRARVLADVENTPSAITVKDGKLKLHTETKIGEVTDTFAFPDCPELDIIVSAALIQRSLQICDRFAILENCIVFEKDGNLLQVIANRTP